MSAQQDTDERFGAMEYFILALIGKAELKSLYEFQNRASLQPGGIRPALQRLEEAGHIARADAGARNRRDFSVTTRGMKFLEHSWTRSLLDYPDGESVVRAACVAILMNEVQTAAAYLEGVAGGRRNAAKERLMDAERLEERGLDPLNAYAWMRTLTEAQRREGESNAFVRLGRSLKEQQQQHDVQSEEAP